MKLMILALLLSTFAYGEEAVKEKDKFKKTVNTAADNIDHEARKVIKKGKEVWNNKINTPPPKKK